MGGPLNGPGIRDAILTKGKKATEATAYLLFLGKYYDRSARFNQMCSNH